MKIFLIGGKAKHGKGQTALYIKEYYDLLKQKTIITGFSKYLKMYAKEIIGYNEKTDKKPRDFLQNLGSEIIREKLNNPYFLINRIKEDLDIYQFFADNVIIADVRFPLEIEAIKKEFKNVYSIHVKRENFDTKLTKKEKMHDSETSLDNYSNFDYQIDNTELIYLKNDVFDILERIKQ